MTHDRADGDRLPLTHGGLAAMPGVRRAGVIEAVGALRAAGIVAWGKGEVVVLDRAALEAAASECHGVLRDRVERPPP